MKKVMVFKIINGDTKDVSKIVSKIDELKKDNKDLEDYQFIVTNDKLDFYTPKRFIKEMMGIVDELKKLEAKK